MKTIEADFTVENKWFEAMKEAEVIRLTDGTEFVRKDIAAKIMASYNADLKNRLKRKAMELEQRDEFSITSFLKLLQPDEQAANSTDNT